MFHICGNFVYKTIINAKGAVTFPGHFSFGCRIVASFML